MFKNVSKEMQNSKLTHIIKKVLLTNLLKACIIKDRIEFVRNCFEL
jgi:hypothetical protein